MEATDIRYEQVLVKDLPTFADRYIKNAQPDAYIAITQQRADALVQNPMSAPEDVGMIVAYAGDELVGYFGIMPILIRQGGRSHKVHWFTTWNVSANVRGKGVGSGLMQAALEIKQDYMIVGSAPARHVCRKFGFTELGTLKIAKLDLYWKAKRNPQVMALRVARKMFNIFGGKLDIHERSEAAASKINEKHGARHKAEAYQDLIRAAGELPEAISMREVLQVRPLGHGGAKTIMLNEASFERNVDVINWMLSMLWVLPLGESVSEELDYYFTDAREEFEYIAWGIYKNLDEHEVEEYVGYIVFQVQKIDSRRVMRVLDVDVLSKDWILPLALKLGKEKNVDLIEMNAMHASRISGSPACSTRKRVYQCYFEHETSPLANAWQHMALDMPDGDMAFT